MTRKDFLRKSLWGSLGALMSLGLIRCKSSSAPTDPTTNRTFVSTYVDLHFHNITIQKSEVETPPSSGISRATSSSGVHTHNFAMTLAELQTVNGGGTVVVATSVAEAHQHMFTITKWF